jgi:site-specific DNA recombinase
MYADKLISREELVEYRKQIDQEVAELETAKIVLQERLEACKSEVYAIDLGKKLRGVSILSDLIPQVLHSLVNKLTWSIDSNLRIQYNFVNPFEEQR